jgi:FeS assembly SUF system protein
MTKMTEKIQENEERGATPEAPTEAKPSAESASAPAPEHDQLKDDLVAALKTVFDPEIPVDIYELGLIYKVDVDAGGKVAIQMTLTSPACPVAGSLPGEVEQKLRGIPGVTDASIDLVWDPPWNPSLMSEAAKLELGF